MGNRSVISLAYLRGRGVFTEKGDLIAKEIQINPRHPLPTEILCWWIRFLK